MAPTPPFPLFTTLPPRSVLDLKGITTTSWVAFAIDTQGKIPYTSTYKKGVLIHIHLIITGRVIDAQETLRIGLANEVVPKGTSLERSFELARYICRLPQPAIRTDKEAAVRGFGLPLTASVNASRRSTAGQIFSKDYDSPDLSDPWLILHYGSVN